MVDQTLRTTRWASFGSILTKCAWSALGRRRWLSASEWRSTLWYLWMCWKSLEPIAIFEPFFSQSRQVEASTSSVSGAPAPIQGRDNFACGRRRTPNNQWWKVTADWLRVWWAYRCVAMSHYRIMASTNCVEGKKIEKVISLSAKLSCPLRLFSFQKRVPFSFYFFLCSCCGSIFTSHYFSMPTTRRIFVNVLTCGAA